MKNRILIAVAALLVIAGAAHLLSQPDINPGMRDRSATPGAQDGRLGQRLLTSNVQDLSQPEIARGSAKPARGRDIPRRLEEYLLSREFLMEESATALLDLWPYLLAQTESDTLSTLTYAFAERLRAVGDDAAYTELAATLYDSSGDPASVMRTLTVLRWTATPGAARVLAEFLINGRAEGEIGGMLRNCILEVAQSPLDADTRREVASILSWTWEQLDTHAPVVDQFAIAQGIASLSTPEGARTLVDTLSAPSRGNNQQRAIAAAALGQFEHDDALPVFASVLADPEQDPEVTRAAMAGLVSINNADAYEILLGGLSNAWGRDMQVLLRDREIADEAVALIEDALNKRTLEDPKVTAFLREVLAAQTLVRAQSTPPHSPEQL